MRNVPQFCPHLFSLFTTGIASKITRVARLSFLQYVHSYFMKNIYKKNYKYGDGCKIIVIFVYGTER